LVDELYYLRENGIEDWLTKKEREGCCPQCGKKVYWCTRTCPECGTGVR
jgi:predicted amidophosphoribosyltransferase